MSRARTAEGDAGGGVASWLSVSALCGETKDAPQVLGGEGEGSQVTLARVALEVFEQQGAIDALLRTGVAVEEFLTSRTVVCVRVGVSLPDGGNLLAQRGDSLTQNTVAMFRDCFPNTAPIKRRFLGEHGDSSSESESDGGSDAGGAGKRAASSRGWSPQWQQRDNVWECRFEWGDWCDRFEADQAGHRWCFALAFKSSLSLSTQTMLVDGKKNGDARCLSLPLHRPARGKVTHEIMSFNTIRCSGEGNGGKTPHEMLQNMRHRYASGSFNRLIEPSQTVEDAVEAFREYLAQEGARDTGTLLLNPIMRLQRVLILANSSSPLVYRVTLDSGQ